ncbi:MAG: NADH-quinone oxidoreductase subunit N [Pseudomonadota bacterium]
MIEMMILLPEIILALTACTILMLGSFTKKHCFKGLNFIVAIFLTVALYILLYKTPYKEELLIFGSLFKSNMLIINLKSLILATTILYIFIYKDSRFLENSMLKTYEFSVIFLLSIVGMMLMLSANNFLSFYISLELQSLCLYVLAAFEREDSKSSEAGLKYFILGSFASGLLLFGISFVYGFTGNVDFDSLEIFLNQTASTTESIGIIIGLIMILIGLFFKVSAAPFHMWTPDVYQGSPTIVTTMFATIGKIASVGFLYRLTSESLSGWGQDLQPILLLITCASLMIGALGALKQNNLKRLLAYSSIGHVGFMLLAISSFFIDSTILLYLLIYTTMTLGTFIIIMSLNASEIKDLAGLSRKNPILALSLAIFMLSLAGIPPFAGFFAKFYVFQVAIKAEFFITSIIAIIAAVISAYYYLKIVKTMYFDASLTENIDVNLSYSTKVILALLVLFNIFYVFF